MYFMQGSINALHRRSGLAAAPGDNFDALYVVRRIVGCSLHGLEGGCTPWQTNKGRGLSRLGRHGACRTQRRDMYE